MDESEFTSILEPALSHELNHVEFKSAGPWTTRATPLKLKVIKAVLAMANLWDGGYVVIGVDEDSSGTPVPIGVPSHDMGTWRYDWVARQVTNFADPPVQFRMDKPTYRGARFVVISVNPFEEVPIICKASAGTGNGPLILKKNEIYIRPIGAIETVPVNSVTEMRRLISMATDRSLGRLIRQLIESGGAIVPWTSS